MGARVVLLTLRAGLLQLSMKMLQRVMRGMSMSLTSDLVSSLAPSIKGWRSIICYNTAITIKHYITHPSAPSSYCSTLSQPYSSLSLPPSHQLANGQAVAGWLMTHCGLMLICDIIGQYYIRQMYNPLSTRSKQPSQQKLQSARFFKKLSTNDENERNVLNFADRPQLKACQSTKHIVSLFQSENRPKMFSKSKKTPVQLISLTKTASKAHISLCHTEQSHHSSQKEHSKALKKDNSSRNLKLLSSGSSSQFPQIMPKSASQTTIHRKMDQNKLKLLEKMGAKKRSAHCSSQLSMGSFKLGAKLGSGRFGNVYLAEEKATRGLYALKVMSKSKIKEADMVEQVFWEIKLQIYMNHPNILKLYGVFDDSKNIYLILEYCSQCLFRDFRAKVKLTEEETAYYGKQVIAALKYMHNESIIHRDIKPQNIMLQHGVLKMSDFGWSTYAPTYKRQTFCGTVDYVPPEIVEGNQYDERVDIWALGILMYELASGHAPFQTKDQNVTYQKIVNSQCKFPNHFSKGLKDAVGKILDKNPEKRPNLDQIERQSWFQKYKGVGRYISKEIWTAWSELC